MLGLDMPETTIATLRQDAARLRRLGVPFGTSDLALGPDIRDWTDAVRLEQACQAVFAGVDRIIADHCGGDLLRFAALAGTPEHELELLDATAEEDWALVARPDVVIAGDRIAVVEPNAVSMSALFATHDLLARLYYGVPGIRAEATRHAARPAYTMGAFAELLRERLVAPNSKVAITYWAREDLGDTTQSYWHYATLQAELRRYGVETVFCPVEALELHPDRVLFEGSRIGVIYRHFESPEPAAAAERATLRRLLAAVADGAAALVNGFLGEVAVSKICLAWLSDETYLAALPADLAETLRRHVPWTRVVQETETTHGAQRIDLLGWAVEHRDRLVLKPVRGHGGIDVVIGREVDAERWERLLTRAVRERADNQWVVQELVDPGLHPYGVTDSDGTVRRATAPVVNSVFVLQRRLVGLIARYGTAGSRNVNGGTGFTPAPVFWTGLPESGRATGAEPDGQVTTIEQVSRVWGEVLAVEHVGPDDDFFADLGGHSLAAAAAVGRLAEIDGTPLDLYQIYLAPTPREFVERLAAVRARLAELDTARRIDPLGAFADALTELGPTTARTFLDPAARLRVADGELVTGADDVMAELRDLVGPASPRVVRRGRRKVSLAVEADGADGEPRTLVLAGEGRDGLVRELTVTEGPA